MSFIQINKVSRHFDTVRAVDDVSLEIDQGEFFALLGPSGCGKTTLLRMLGGFEEPDTGDITIDGEPMSHVQPYQRPVNMVFQSYAIFPHLNVGQNIAFGLRKERLARAEQDRRVAEALSMIRLEGYEQRQAHELSGGQRQRVALARALIKQPKVLLLDEPLGALDKQLREQMQIELRELQRNLGITFVFVTHDQEEALTMSDRIAVMSDGRVLEAGAPAQLYGKPQTRFVAGFLGAMNFFDATIKQKLESEYIVETAGLGTISVARDASVDFSIDETVSIGLRPEILHISAVADSSGSKNGVRAVVRTSAFLGDRSHLFVELASRDKPVIVAQQNAARNTVDKLSEGSAVNLTWPASAPLILKTHES